jgi:uncharacterized membrane protein YdjX (TVP38/TMEM64 family)
MDMRKSFLLGTKFQETRDRRKRDGRWDMLTQRSVPAIPASTAGH